MKTRVLLLAGVVAAIAAGRAVADEPVIISRVALLSATTNAPSGATGLATFYPEFGPPRTTSCFPQRTHRFSTSRPKDFRPAPTRSS